MSLFSAIYVGFGAIQTFMALSFLLLGRRSALARRQARFGVVALFLGAASFLQFCELEASSPWQSALFQSLALSAHFATLFAFVPFARAYFDLEPGRFTRPMLLLVAAGLVPVLAGFAFDPGRMLVAESPLIPGPERPAARMTPVGIVAALVGMSGYAVAWSPAIRRVFRDGVGGELLLVASFTTLGYVSDFAHHVLGLRALPIAPVSGLLFSLALSLIILRNYIEVRAALERQALELRLRHDQIAHIETEIDKKESLAIVGELSAVIARQIQSPVATLREASADLRIDALPEEARASTLDVIDSETNRLNRLVSDLLTYARPVEPQLETVEILSIWNEAMASVERETGARLRSQVDFPLAATRFDGDRRLLREAVKLLLENAAGFLDEGDVIHVRGRIADDGGRPCLRAEIGDSGHWIETIARSTLGSRRRQGEHAVIDALELGIIDKILTAHQGSFRFEKTKRGDVVAVAILPLRAELTE